MNITWPFLHAPDRPDLYVVPGPAPRPIKTSTEAQQHGSRKLRSWASAELHLQPAARSWKQKVCPFFRDLNTFIQENNAAEFRGGHARQTLRLERELDQLNFECASSPESRVPSSLRLYEVSVGPTMLGRDNNQDYPPTDYGGGTSPQVSPAQHATPRDSAYDYLPSYWDSTRLH
ncbi:hypothetical protein DHEL01_v200367 [Diaporthe helianthi]|uniref:Uncharacterized protein n=1 Tax=Diaporthe helianthi TaxID=158607 RepID=A0A2P5IFD8_DIAHE|nr:hypothetical protein DHEL01_v200367 [Diaporthe helianthi]